MARVSINSLAIAKPSWSKSAAPRRLFEGISDGFAFDEAETRREDNDDATLNSGGGGSGGMRCDL